MRHFTSSVRRRPALAGAKMYRQVRGRAVQSPRIVRRSSSIWLAVCGSAALAASLSAQKPASLPRTPDGHPDLQGVWTHGTATPFERPAALGTKAFYTPAEAE